MTESKKNKRSFTGVVISTKMDKTAVVKVDRVKAHPVYQKRFKVSKKYKIHDSKNECHDGDKIVFEECRPLSKEKHWRLVKVINSNS